MPAIRPFLKKAISWLFVVIGVAIGVFGVSVLGMNSPDHHASSFFFLFGFAVSGFVPLLASFIALRHRRRASFLCFLAAPVVGLSLVYCGPDILGVIFASIQTVPLILLGLFWFVTSALRWEPLIESRETSRKQRLIFCLTGILIGVLVLLTTVFFVAYLPLPMVGDCNGASPFPIMLPKSPEHAVFVARTIYVGTKEQSPWAVMVVQQHFWGLPRCNRKIVLARGAFLKGGTYFVDGELTHGLLTRLMSVVDFPYCGSRTTLLNYAAVDLRVIHDGPPKTGVRIIGEAMNDSYQPVPDAKVLVTGPEGTRVVTTDARGIYDVAGLPPGEYTINDDPDLARQGIARQDKCEVSELKQGQAWGCTLFLRYESEATDGKK